MRSVVRVIVVAAALGLPLGGCGTTSSDFDPMDWIAGDWFSTKKPLPGERTPVFPEGVPGVARGVPSELMKDNQRAAALADEQQNIEPAQEVAAREEPKAKPKPKARPKPKPKAVTASEPEQQQPQQQPAPPRQPPPRQQPQVQWPDPPQSRPQPQPQVQWPDPPPPR